MKFNDFLGNDFLKEQFLSFVQNKKIPHAIILEGEKGLGKSTFAKLLSKLFLCSDFNEDFCNKCSNCNKIEKDIHPDVIYPETSGTLNTYSVATVRKIREDAFILPNEAPFKIYIFKNADNMNLSSQNSLLKILEEPPANVIFIFTCKNRRSFLETIISRSQVFTLEPVSESLMSDYLKRNFNSIKDEKLKALLETSKGNIGLLLEIISETNKEESHLLAQDIIKALLTKNESKLLFSCSKIPTDKISLSFLLSDIANIFRDALILSYKTSESAESLKSSNSGLSFSVAEEISKGKILKIIDLLNEINNLSLSNVNNNLLFTYFCSSIYSLSFESKN